MYNLSELLIFILPLLIVSGVFLFLLVLFFKREKVLAINRAKEQSREATLNVRLQAFERMLLFLERIKPQNIVLRSNDPGMTAVEFHRYLLTTIREEYEHNLVQQLYISEEAWNHVVSAKAWVTKLINEAAGKIQKNNTSNDLAVSIIRLEMDAGENKINEALSFLKKEARELF